MRFFFKKRKEYYKVLKLFKVVDNTSAKEFSVKKFLISSIDLIKNDLRKSFRNFEINYGTNAWKSELAFNKGIKKLQDTSIITSFLATEGDDSSSYFLFENSLLNSVDEPKYGILNIELAIEESLCDTLGLINFTIKKSELLDFDYGYIVGLDESYDFSSERKKKARLFGFEVSVEEIDMVWRSHGIAMNKGYFKKLYPINLINQSHLSQDIIKEFMKDEIGEFNQMNNKIVSWSLNQEQYNLALKKLQESKYLVSDELTYKRFLSTTEASEFYYK